MQISLEGTGDLKKYMGEDLHQIDLNDNAVVADLLPIIGQKWGSAFPPHFWNVNKQQFRGPVIFVVNKVAVRNLNRELKHGDQVQLVKALVGG
jgi:sulfur carrier protein ThiS